MHFNFSGGLRSKGPMWLRAGSQSSAGSRDWAGGGAAVLGRDPGRIQGVAQRGVPRNLRPPGMEAARPAGDLTPLTLLLTGSKRIHYTCRTWGILR